MIAKEFFRVKEIVGNLPSRMDLFTYMDEDVYQLAITHAKDNPFKRYLEFLNGLNDVDIETKTLANGLGNEFINLIEKTSMTKVYKKPILMAFYNKGNIKLAVTQEELLRVWKEFFGT